MRHRPAASWVRTSSRSPSSDQLRTTAVPGHPLLVDLDRVVHRPGDVVLDRGGVAVDHVARRGGAEEHGLEAVLCVDVAPGRGRGEVREGHAVSAPRFEPTADVGAQLALGDLAARRAGSASTTTRRSGNHSGDTPRSRRKATSVVEVEVAARFELDVEAHPLAEHLVGHRDRGRERDGGVLRYLGLHRRRADVLAAADDDVGRAADDAQVAVGVDGAQVADEHPAVGGEQLVVGARRRRGSRGRSPGPCTRDGRACRGSVTSTPSSSSRRTCMSTMSAARGVQAGARGRRASSCG